MYGQLDKGCPICYLFREKLPPPPSPWNLCHSGGLLAVSTNAPVPSQVFNSISNLKQLPAAHYTVVIVISGMQLYDCVAPYVYIIVHRGRFWAKCIASGSVRWCCFRSHWMVLSHVMLGRPGCLRQSAGGQANRILLASALSFMRTMCPNRASQRDWIIAVSLDSLRCS